MEELNKSGMQCIPEKGYLLGFAHTLRTGLCIIQCFPNNHSSEILPNRKI